jgi:acetyl-CoA carboxylase biotin carboxylase subunit
MFSKILVANRGEIAVRIIRACRDMGIISVAVYSEADKDALHTQIADEAICIGPAKSADSYLNKERIISACLASGAGALHPGFGFLSENAEFANMVKENGIVFIGPDSEIITKMGDKAQARKTMQAANVPVIPGSDGLVGSLNEAKEIAKKIGYPIMIKATAGGGGRGIRLVNEESEIEKAFNTAKSEAAACFSDDGVYIEKFIVKPHHIEFQILADNYGNTVHLFERECSVQRRNQKLIEESPSPFLTEDLREKMGQAAVKAAKAVGYQNAGTIEFLVDYNRDFYFMEMNTRIQVEHPVTELVTDLDLIKLQIEVAFGNELKLKQSDVKQTGHAIECRINAEDARRDFAPCPGKINALHVPGGPGVRVDSAVYQGYSIPPFYDSMIAKLIVKGSTREEAISRMKRAIAEFLFDGITTNSDFQLEILKDSDFAKGEYDTGFLQSHNITERLRNS